jgi:BetI-type transcriptional repressor, C-terminal
VRTRSARVAGKAAAQRSGARQGLPPRRARCRALPPSSASWLTALQDLGGHRPGRRRPDGRGPRPALEAHRLHALLDGLALHAVLRPASLPLARVVAIVARHLDSLRRR